MHLCLKALFSVVTVLSLAALPACGEGETEPEPELSTDELRTQSEDLFKPASAPVQVIPATLKGLVAWELYSSTGGTTVIGRSASKKRKAIFVQVLNTRDPSRVAFKGSGYLVASDFRLDAGNTKHELELLGNAIRADVSAFAAAADAGVAEAPLDASFPEAEAPPPAAPPPQTTPPAIHEESPEQASAPPAPATAPTTPPSPCVRQTMRVVLFGLDLLKDVATVAAAGPMCPATVVTCFAAVASFAHGAWLLVNVNELTCEQTK